MKINKNSLQTLLIRNWTEVICPRQLLNYIHTNYNKKDVKNLKITRFELLNEKFIIWVEFFIQDSNILFEFETDRDGNLVLINKI